MRMARTRDSHLNELGEVKRCDCGGYNLTMGPLTLHFTADEAALLADLTRAGTALMSESASGDRAAGAGDKSHGTLH